MPFRCRLPFHGRLLIPELACIFSFGPGGFALVPEIWPRLSLRLVVH